MTKGWAQVLAISIVLNAIFVPSFVMTKFKLDNANKEIAIQKGLNQDTNSAVAEAYADCRRMLLMDGIMQRANGCISGIETLCARTTIPKTCMDKLGYACGGEDVE